MWYSKQINKLHGTQDIQSLQGQCAVMEDKE